MPDVSSPQNNSFFSNELSDRLLWRPHIMSQLYLLTLGFIHHNFGNSNQITTFYHFSSRTLLYYPSNF